MVSHIPCGFPASWWHHQMETFSALLRVGLCAGNSVVIGEFPAQRPVTRSFDVFFDLRLNQRLSKQCPWRIPCWFLFRYHPVIKLIVVEITSIADIATPSHWHPRYLSNSSDLLLVSGVKWRNCKCTYRSSPPKSHLDERVCYRFKVLKMKGAKYNGFSMNTPSFQVSIADA